MSLITRTITVLLVCLVWFGTPLRCAGQFASYHQATSAQHQSYFNTYSGQGYRMISLSVYGDPANPLYAAVWVKRAGPAWVAAHGLNGSQYQNMYDTYTPQGYRPTLITATGSGSSTVFAIVMEKSSVTWGWAARHGLVSGSNADSSTIQYWMKWAQDNGYIPIQTMRYGTAGSPNYGVVLIGNPTNIQWNWFDGVDASGYQNYFNAFTAMLYRPAFPVLSDSSYYLSVFRDDSVGGYYAVHDLSSADYQTAFNTYTGQGYYPISVQGGGIGSGARYAAVFAKQDSPIARQWTITGSAPTGMSAANAAAFDNAIKNWMQYHGVRAGQLAFTQNGKMLYSRAFTWAEPGYPTTQTYSPMRLASCSKAFAAACITKLLETHPNLLSQPIFSLLGINSKALNWQTVDSRINSVTVQECVDHTGGWDRDVYDPVFDCRNIEQQLGKNGPITNWDMAHYMYGMPLQRDPGTTSEYFNFGYVLLGLVVEKLSGQTFEDYLSQNVLQPLGISDVNRDRTDISLRQPNEGFCNDPNVGLTDLDPNASTILGAPYGGGGYLTEAMNTGGGLSTTAGSLATFVHNYAAWGLGGRAPGAARTGGMAGCISRIESWPYTADFGFIFNTARFQPGTADANQDLAVTLENLLKNLPPHVSALAAVPATQAGGLSSTGTVTLDWAAPVGGATVTLSSSNTAVATVPASVTIAEGQTSGTFTITNQPRATSGTSVITVSYNGTNKTKTVTSTPPTWKTLTLSPTSVYGGTNVTGTITVNGVAAVDTSISLSSANSAAHVPASVTLPAGQSSVTFTVTTDPVTSSTAGSISATMSGVSKSATLTVKPPVLSTLTLSPNPVKGGNSVAGTVTMSGPVAVNTTVNLTNANPKAHLPGASVTIPAGSASVTFTMTTDPTAANVSGAVKATVGAVSKSVTLKVTP